jgi:uncharacterized membrane protein
MTDIGAVGHFDLGRVISRTFGLIGRNFVAFTFLSLLLVGGPQFGIVLFQSYVAQALMMGIDPVGLALGAALVTMVLAYVLMAVLTRASIDALSRGSVSLGAALGAGVRFFFPLFIVALLTGIGVFLGALLLIVPGLYLATRWAVATPALVAEDLGPTAALGRSAELTEGRRWAVFGLLLLYLVLAWIVEVGFTALAGAATASADFVAPLDVFTLTISGVGAVVGALTSMVSAVGTAALYVELRQAKEGVSIADLAAVFE